MRGIVSQPLVERARPNVNAQVTRPYDVYDVLDVKRSSFGYPIEGNDVWYQLSNGNYVWSGAVTVQPDCSNLAPEDHDQFLLCFRKRYPDGRPDLDAKIAPDNLYFAPLRLPSLSDSVKVNDLLPNAFIDGVMRSLEKIEASRKHVFVYIHGYQLLPSLKLDLLENFVMSYFTQPEKKIAKVLFLTWPAFSFGRKYIDDYAIEAGQQFTAQGHLNLLAQLSQALQSKGRYLNLIVHSFGHQFLNGILNPPLPNAEKIFENIFLMASDITQMSMTRGGFLLPNQWSAYGRSYKYGYSQLAKISNKVYSFYDPHDYLLHSSSKKFVRDTLTSDMQLYKNLGNFGDQLLGQKNPLPPPEFEYININLLPGIEDESDLLDYPFQKPRPGPELAIKQVLDHNDYDGICDIKIILNIGRFGDRHRYLFTCKPVVNEVLRLLS